MSELSTIAPESNDVAEGVSPKLTDLVGALTILPLMAGDGTLPE